MSSTARATWAFIIALLLTGLSREDTLQAGPDVAKPAFEKLAVKIEYFDLHEVDQPEELRIEGTGRCWYQVKGREAQRTIPARPPAVFDHQLSEEHIRRLNERLEGTGWLTAPGGDGRATRTHGTTITLALTRDGQERSVVCRSGRPEPYGSLLHAIQGLATQERRVYLYSHVRGETGLAAWAETGREIAALRGDPSGEPPFQIDYRRYLPIARWILHPFHVREDEELIPAVRLIGHFRAESELKILHQMAHDRSSNLRAEVAWALWRIRDPDSLPVLASMMSAPANREAAALRLVEWGEDAVPHIVKLIDMSTDAERDEWGRTTGEDMIRAYLDHWNRLEHPVDPRVITAVRKALDRVPPDNGTIRTTYHREFLERAVTSPPASASPP